MCSVSCWVSSSTTPPSRIRSTRSTSAALDASLSRWNIDSPLNTRPVSTPYRPPTSRSPSQTSRLCAPPARVQRDVAPLHRRGDPGLAAGAGAGGDDLRRTPRRRWSCQPQSRSRRRSDLDTRRSPGSRTARGSGEHQGTGRRGAGQRGHRTRAHQPARRALQRGGVPPGRRPREAARPGTRRAASPRRADRRGRRGRGARRRRPAPRRRRPRPTAPLRGRSSAGSGTRQAATPTRPMRSASGRPSAAGTGSGPVAPASAHDCRARCSAVQSPSHSSAGTSCASASGPTARTCCDEPVDEPALLGDAGLPLGGRRARRQRRQGVDGGAQLGAGGGRHALTGSTSRWSTRSREVLSTIMPT